MQHLNLWEGKGQNNFPFSFQTTKSSQNIHSFLLAAFFPFSEESERKSPAYTHTKDTCTHRHTHQQTTPIFLCVYSSVYVCASKCYLLWKFSPAIGVCWRHLRAEKIRPIVSVMETVGLVFRHKSGRFRLLWCFLPLFRHVDILHLLT